MLNGLKQPRNTTEEKISTKSTPNNQKMAIGTYMSIITLNVIGLNAPTKRHRLAEWIQKQDPYMCCLQETHFRPQDTYRLKVRGWKNIFHANGKQKKAGVAILISDKIYLKIKKVTRDKQQVTYKGNAMLLTAYLSEETLQARENGRIYLKY